MNNPETDPRFMASALTLARRGLGQVWPNPAVGCVLVAPDGVVVGRGWTQPGGRPHAETEALRRAGDRAKGAIAYVTLEPCNHHGQTPPCSEALVAAGVARVVIACGDTDPRVAGAGICRLRTAGIEVTTGVLEAQALALNEGFFARLGKGRPIVTLKVAASLDGRIATASGDSHWITGPAARAQGHRLRGNHDAIMVGIGTALADDPSLTCRLPGLEGRSPVRVVVDSAARLPADAVLARTAGDVRTLLFAAEGRADQENLDRLVAAGVDVNVGAQTADGRVDLDWMMAELASDGITRVLVEGGGGLAAGLLAADLVDRLAWFNGPLVIGGGGIPAVASLQVRSLGEAPRFVADGALTVDGDGFATYSRVTQDND